MSKTRKNEEVKDSYITAELERLTASIDNALKKFLGASGTLFTSIFAGVLFLGIQNSVDIQIKESLFIQSTYVMTLTTLALTVITNIIAYYLLYLLENSAMSSKESFYRINEYMHGKLKRFHLIPNRKLATSVNYIIAAHFLCAVLSLILLLVLALALTT